MSEPIVVTFTYTRDEYIRAIRRHYQSALQVRRDLIGGAAAVAGGLYLAATSDVAWLGWVLFGVGAVLLAMIAYAMFLLPRSGLTVIPRRALSAGNADERLREMLERHVGPRLARRANRP